VGPRERPRKYACDGTLTGDVRVYHKAKRLIWDATTHLKEAKKECDAPRIDL